MKTPAILLTLTLLLAACGGQTPTPAPPEQPPVEQPPPTQPEPPVTPPVTPAPPPTEPEPPAQEVPYYGEWAWNFEQTGQYAFYEEEGRFSIVQTLEALPPETGFGFYQICYQGNCYGTPEGGVVFGPNDDGELSIRMYRLDAAGDDVTTYEATDSDGELEADDQGRLVFEGRGRYLDYGNETLTGNFTAILTDFPVTFPPVE
jgi:hypothetical protein